MVKKAVTASAPSEPSAPSVPSEPAEPPSTLNIFKLSSKESLDTVTVNGSFVLLPPTVPLNVIEPLTCPVPSVTLALSVGSDKVAPFASTIVKSPVVTVPLKFC